MYVYSVIFRKICFFNKPEPDPEFEDFPAGGIDDLSTAERISRLSRQILPITNRISRLVQAALADPVATNYSNRKVQTEWHELILMDTYFNPNWTTFGNWTKFALNTPSLFAITISNNPADSINYA